MPWLSLSSPPRVSDRIGREANSEVRKRTGLARRAAIANRLTSRSACDEVAEEEDFTTESTKICRGEEGLLSGCPRLIAFGNSASVRGNGLRMDVLQRKSRATPEPPGSVSSGTPKETSVLSVVNFPWK
jgi:hypothetical protein